MESLLPDAAREFFIGVCVFSTQITAVGRPRLKNGKGLFCWISDFLNGEAFNPSYVINNRVFFLIICGRKKN